MWPSCPLGLQSNLHYVEALVVARTRLAGLRGRGSDLGVDSLLGLHDRVAGVRAHRVLVLALAREVAVRVAAVPGFVLLERVEVVHRAGRGWVPRPVTRAIGEQSG